MNRNKILDIIKALSEAQFKELAFRAGPKPSDLPGSATAQTITAIELIQWHESRPEGLSKLVTHLGTVLGSPILPFVQPDPQPSAPVSGAAPKLIQEGQPWTCPHTGIEFLWVPAGEFWMGSTPHKPPKGTRPEIARRYDEEAYEDEYPGGLVAIEHGYWIAKHPVTHEDYAHFLTERGSMWPKTKPARWGDPQAQRAADVPMVNVDWFDALLFCHWLTDKLASKLPAGHRILLPTEAQWERAARGTDARKYPWGDEAPTPKRAVFGGAPLSAVGARPAGVSPVGCHDMAGNIWEWCLTACNDDLDALNGAACVTRPPCGLSSRGWSFVTDARRLADKPDSSTEPVCANARALRSGSWIVAPRELRCALRGRFLPSDQDDDVGFRVCCVRVPHPADAR
jgi:formylglycine-generating enzyme required for sulfatase activity